MVRALLGVLNSIAMSERKNIKRNKNRVKAKDRPFAMSIQRSYYKPKPPKEENKDQLKLL